MIVNCINTIKPPKRSKPIFPSYKCPQRLNSNGHGASLLRIHVGGEGCDGGGVRCCICPELLVSQECLTQVGAAVVVAAESGLEAAGGVKQGSANEAAGAPAAVVPVGGEGCQPASRALPPLHAAFSFHGPHLLPGRLHACLLPVAPHRYTPPASPLRRGWAHAAGAQDRG